MLPQSHDLPGTATSVANEPKAQLTQINEPVFDMPQLQVVMSTQRYNASMTLWTKFPVAYAHIGCFVFHNDDPKAQLTQINKPVIDMPQLQVVVSTHSGTMQA